MRLLVRSETGHFAYFFLVLSWLSKYKDAMLSLSQATRKPSSLRCTRTWKPVQDLQTFLVLPLTLKRVMLHSSSSLIQLSQILHLDRAWGVHLSPSNFYRKNTLNLFRGRMAQSIKVYTPTKGLLNCFHPVSIQVPGCPQIESKNSLHHL
ncbi:hypothetical protein K439DRAFT_379085 [Ramaria rubella]|nr:hypothetical protein K439DRAFT_379085 [Ramaria rubella]